jgi:hypothetical protein
VSPKSHFGSEAHPRRFGQGDIVELVADQKHEDVQGAINSLVGELRSQRLEAVPVAVLVHGA